jgi:hypothetical protein
MSHLPQRSSDPGEHSITTGIKAEERVFTSIDIALSGVLAYYCHLFLSSFAAVYESFVIIPGLSAGGARWKGQRSMNIRSFLLQLATCFTEVPDLLSVSPGRVTLQQRLQLF